MIRVKKCETTGFEPGKFRPGFLYVTLHCWPWCTASPVSRLAVFIAQTPLSSLLRSPSVEGQLEGKCKLRSLHFLVTMNTISSRVQAAFTTRRRSIEKCECSPVVDRYIIPVCVMVNWQKQAILCSSLAVENATARLEKSAWKICCETTCARMLVELPFLCSAQDPSLLVSCLLVSPFHMHWSALTKRRAQTTLTTEMVEGNSCFGAFLRDNASEERERSA